MTTQSTILKDSTPANTITLDNTDGVFSVKKGEGSTTTIASISSTGLTAPVASSNVTGTTTNDNAAAGYVGEYLTGTASGTSITHNTAVSIASVSLTAGDWDVQGMGQFSTAATTAVSMLTTSINTSVAAGGNYSMAGVTYPASVLNTGANGAPTIASQVTRISIATTTTVYLIALCYFSVSTMTANGYIHARRVR